MKKISVIFVCLILGAWWYLANKFEEQVKLDVANLSHDKDSMLIEKYKFRVTLHDFAIYLNSLNKNIKLDKLTLNYNPITDRVTAKFGGDRFSFGEGEMGLYIPDPDLTFTFNRSLARGDWENFKLNFNLKDFSIYSSKSDKIISQFKNLNADLSNESQGDMCDIKVSCKTQYFKNNLNTQYINNTTKLMSSSEDSKNDSKFFKSLEKVIEDPRIVSYLDEFQEEFGITTYNCNYSAKLEKKNVVSLVEVHKGNKSLKEFLSEFSYLNSKYSVFLNEKQSNNLMNNILKIQLDNNGKKIISKVDIQNAIQLDDKRQEDLKTMIYSVIVDILKESGDKDKKTKITSMLYTEIAGLILAIKDSQLHFDFDYDIASHDFSKKLKAVINGVIYDLEGEFKDKKYDGIFKISYPKALTETLPKVYNEKFKTILTKIADSSEDLYESFDKKYVPVINQAFDNIRENGFGVISSLHKEQDLGADEELNMNIKINFNEVMGNPDILRINDRNYFEIISDPRVTKFMKNMKFKQEEQE